MKFCSAVTVLRQIRLLVSERKLPVADRSQRTVSHTTLRPVVSGQFSEAIGRMDRIVTPTADMDGPPYSVYGLLPYSVSDKELSISIHSAGMRL